MRNIHLTVQPVRKYTSRRLLTNLIFNVCLAMYFIISRQILDCCWPSWYSYTISRCHIKSLKIKSIQNYEVWIATVFFPFRLLFSMKPTIKLVATVMQQSVIKSIVTWLQECSSQSLVATVMQQSVIKSIATWHTNLQHDNMNEESHGYDTVQADDTNYIPLPTCDQQLSVVDERTMLEYRCDIQFCRYRYDQLVQTEVQLNC